MKFPFTSIALLCMLPFFLLAQKNNWTSTYFPGMKDANGQFAAGNEIMQIVAHKGKLYAGNSYWQEFDTINNPRSCEILRLDNPKDKWQVDKGLTTANLRIGAMKSFIFTTNYLGNAITPDTLLITVPNDNTGKLTYLVRNDATNTWISNTLATLSSDINCRALGLHKDAVNNTTYVFAGLQDYGIFSGRYNPASPGKIQWNTKAEFITPPNERVMGFTVCNSTLYAATSDGGIGHIYKRTDGSAAWTLVKTTTGGANAEDLRGLSSLPNPNGNGEVLWYCWNKNASRLDPKNNFAETIEYRFTDSLTVQLGISVQYVLAAYNDNIPVFNPSNSAEDIRLIGFELKYTASALTNNPRPNWQGWATDGQYYERHQKGGNVSYIRKYIVNNRPVIQDSLIATRTLCISPFPADAGNVIYAGGMDCNSIPMSRMAWIYRGDFRTATATTNYLQPEKTDYSLYPNPFSNTIRLTNATGNEVFQLINTWGQTFFSGRNIQDADFSALAAGIYFLRISDDKIVGQKTVKLVKQ